MKTATAYYIQLTKAQHDDLNSHPDGWASPIGVAYLRAKDGKIDSTNFDLLEKAATVEFPEEGSNEDVWMILQNRTEGGWRGARGVKCFTAFPRSMDVGDVIVWDNGKRERVASCGFTEITTA